MIEKIMLKNLSRLQNIEIKKIKNLKENLGTIDNRIRNCNIYQKFKKQRTELQKGSVEEILAQNLQN